MNKIDVIHAYLDSIGEVIFASQGWAGVERLNKALAAARELRALKPVAWWNPEYESDFKIALNEFQGWNVPLYALDEVKHD